MPDWQQLPDPIALLALKHRNWIGAILRWAPPRVLTPRHFAAQIPARGALLID